MRSERNIHLSPGEIAGTRDVMIHAYFGVNLGVVWKTAKERLPELKNEIEKILKEKNFK
jgi:uncharacterized protein with HEPN domain